VTEHVLWQDQADPPHLDRRPLAADADVVVVGAGFAGLAAARTLAKAGRQVVVLEKERLGWGAHARNGGMVIPELKSGPATLARKLGPLGTRLHQEVNEAFDWVEALIADEAILCDYDRSGQLYLAHTPRLVPQLREATREHADAGEPVRFVPRDELEGEIGSTAYHGGIVFDRTGGVHPARLHAGLARLAIDAGADVHDHRAARSLEELPDGRLRVTTAAGAVEAPDVIVTTNAYADGFLPELRSRVLPVGSFIVATEVLDPALAAELSPKGRMFVDTKNFLFYWRLTPDGRMLFGGRKSMSPPTLDEATAFLTGSMRRVHPQLAATRVEYQWGGYVAVTLDRLPHVGRLRGAWYATGCNGSGVGLNTWLGHRLAQTVLGEAPPPAFAELKHPRIPLRPLRRAYLPLVGQWFRWQDRA
jgi:glycine/D-amino acid oxidase-like deaminating enzyme